MMILLLHLFVVLILFNVLINGIQQDDEDNMF